MLHTSLSEPKAASWHHGRACSLLCWWGRAGLCGSWGPAVGGRHWGWRTWPSDRPCRWLDGFRGPCAGHVLQMDRRCDFDECLAGVRSDILATDCGGCGTSVCFDFIPHFCGGDLPIALRVACTGRLRLKTGPRAPERRFLPHISVGWDRITATQQRRPVCPLGAGGAGVCWSAVTRLAGRRGG